MFPHLAKEHWGYEYWQERKQLRAKLLKRVNGGRGQTFDDRGDAHLEHGYREYEAVKMISIISH